MTTKITIGDVHSGRLVPTGLDTRHPGQVQRLRADVVKTVTAHMHAGRCDVAADVGRRYSIFVILMALGVPPMHWRQMSQWAAEMKLDEIYAYVDCLVGERCWRSGDDLVSDLVVVEADGVELTSDELGRIVATLLVAGSCAKP